MEKYNQVCVWESTICPIEKSKEFEDFMKSEYSIRAKFLEQIMTLPDVKNGKAVKNTGNRADILFAIHDGDIRKFAISRFKMEPPVRWVEDVLENMADNMIYPEHVREYMTW